jgi:hypothetical protein
MDAAKKKLGDDSFQLLETGREYFWFSHWFLSIM